MSAGGLLRESRQATEVKGETARPAAVGRRRIRAFSAQNPPVELDILILGPVPPPFGGISVHLSRLVPLLERAGFRVGVLNHFGANQLPFVVGALERNPLNYYRLPRKFRARIVHYHHSRWPDLIALALGKRRARARYVLTLHAGDIDKHFPQLVSRVPLVARMTRWALRRFDTVIAVDPQIASIVAPHLGARRIEVVPAFLDESHDEADLYDASTEAFLDSGRVLVVAAYGVQFLDDGRELYGLDTAIDAFAHLARDREELRLAVFVARRPSRRRARRHLARLERRLEHAGVRDRALILFGEPLLPALRRASVFVRPTRAEGDAVSVREAQQAGIHVVASDVIRRPQGVIQFSTGDVADLCAALRDVLDRPVEHIRDTAGANGRPGSDEFAARIIALYRTELALHAAGNARAAPGGR